MGAQRFSVYISEYYGVGISFGSFPYTLTINLHIICFGFQIGLGKRYY